MQLPSHRRLLCVMAVLVAAMLGADYVINEPTAGNPVYGTTSTLATDGEASDFNETVTVKLTKGGVIKDSASVTTPPMSVNWSKDFSPPMGGWPTGNDWKCELWASGVKKVERSFEIR